MPETHLFPIQFDFGSSETRVGPGEIVFTSESGERIRRPAAPGGRVIRGAAVARSEADATAVDDWYSRFRHSWFMVELGARAGLGPRPVEFAAPPTITATRRLSFDIAAEFFETPGKSLSSFPSTPLIEIPVEPINVGDGLLIFYSGYGYKLTATGLTSVLLDGQSSSTSENLSVPLALHTLKVIPATANISKLEAVI